MQVDWDIKDDHLRATVTGSYDAEEAVEEFSRLIAACRKHGLRKVLVDFREIEGERGATERAIYGSEIVALYRMHLDTGGEPLQLAYVGPAVDAEMWNPGMEIAQSSGVNAILTTKMGEAREWLGIE